MPHLHCLLQCGKPKSAVAIFDEGKWSEIIRVHGVIPPAKA